MDETRLAAYQRALLDLRTEIEASLRDDEQTKPVSPDRAIGRLTRQDAMQSQNMALELRRRNQLRLRGIEQALVRIDSGEFGECARCGEEIPEARLAVKPEAPLCVECAGGGRR